MEGEDTPDVWFSPDPVGLVVTGRGAIGRPFPAGGVEPDHPIGERDGHGSTMATSPSDGAIHS